MLCGSASTIRAPFTLAPLFDTAHRAQVRVCVCVQVWAWRPTSRGTTWTPASRASLSTGGVDTAEHG
eukprot:12367043-Alexandrium_andersonii.AAC.1